MTDHNLTRSENALERKTEKVALPTADSNTAPSKTLAVPPRRKSPAKRCRTVMKKTVVENQRACLKGSAYDRRSIHTSRLGTLRIHNDKGRDTNGEAALLREKRQETSTWDRPEGNIRGESQTLLRSPEGKSNPCAQELHVVCPSLTKSRNATPRSISGGSSFTSGCGEQYRAGGRSPSRQDAGIDGSQIKPLFTQVLKEDYFVPPEIPSPQDLTALDSLWKPVRDMENRECQLTNSDYHEDVFAHRGIRVIKSLNPQSFWDGERSKVWSTSKFLQGALSNTKLQDIIGRNVFHKLSSPDDQLQLRAHLLELKRAGNEAQWSTGLWQYFVFRLHQPKKNIQDCPLDESYRTVRQVETRTQRVAFNDTKTSSDSRYSPIASNCHRQSINMSAVPWEYYRGSRRRPGSSGYAYCDISYRVNIQDWVKTLSAVKLYLPSQLLCEVKPSVGLIEKAVNYLALGAATLLHERLKLHWLGSATLSKAPKPFLYVTLPVYFCVHLFALGAHEAHHYICGLRSFGKDSTGRHVIYETTFEEKWDLEERSAFQNLTTKLNIIHAMNNTRGRDAQLSELKAALAAQNGEIPNQHSAFCWRELDKKPVLVLQKLQLDAFKLDDLQLPEPSHIEAATGSIDDTNNCLSRVPPQHPEGQRSTKNMDAKSPTYSNHNDIIKHAPRSKIPRPGKNMAAKSPTYPNHNGITKHAPRPKIRWPGKNMAAKSPTYSNHNARGSKGRSSGTTKHAPRQIITRSMAKSVTAGGIRRGNDPKMQLN
ncbi:hypothetical protein MMC17_010219 [Xylographa soralifera]|nr:hypothetical protein [Xylographa soralifera]